MNVTVMDMPGSMDRPVIVSVAMSMTVSMMMSAGMPMGHPVPRRMGVIVSVPVRPMANTMEPNPDGPSVAGAIIATGARRLGRSVDILARTLTALDVAPVHPALDFAHPVTVIDGLFFLVILLVIVCGSQHQVMGTRRMGIIAHSIAVRRQGQQPHGNG